MFSNTQVLNIYPIENRPSLLNVLIILILFFIHLTGLDFCIRLKLSMLLNKFEIEEITLSPLVNTGCQQIEVICEEHASLGTECFFTSSTTPQQ